MSRKLSFLVTLWWLILCGVLGVCMMLFANRTPMISEQENRMLSGMPSFSFDSMQKGEISEQFESFLTDQFFLRSELVDRANALKHMFSTITVSELLEQEGQEVYVPETSAEDQKEETAAAASNAEEDQPSAEQDKTEQLSGIAPSEDTASIWLNHKDGTRTALLTYDKKNLQKAADVFNLYASLLPAGGKVHVMLAPRSQTANRLALHLDTESGWTSEAEAALQPLVSSNVVLYNAYDILEDAILNGEYIYFRTDHHWTARGAYLAANEMLTSIGYQTIPLSDYQTKTIDGFLGSIYLHERNAKLKDLADQIEVFYPLLPARSFIVSNAINRNELPVIDETKNSYLVFLGGTWGPYRVVTGGYHTGRNMLMVCDSYGNSIAPFFLPYYDNVYMVDFRENYYSRERARLGVRESIRKLGISDIFIVLSESDGIASAFLNMLMPANIN